MASLAAAVASTPHWLTEAATSGRPLHFPVARRVNLTTLPDATVPIDLLDTATFQTLDVCISDMMVSAAATRISGATMATLYAQGTVANNNLVILGNAPVIETRDPVSATTRYRFYVADNNATNVSAATHYTFQLQGTYDPATLDDVVVEHAHTVYATGAGNVLGNCQVITNATNHNVTLAYEWQGTDPNLTAAGLTTAMHTYVNPVWSGNTFIGGPVDTPEMIAAREARQAKLVVVRQRADRLWLAHLNDVQRHTWQKDGYVEVRSPSGRRYRLKNHRSGNVYLLDSQGHEVRKYCAYAYDPKTGWLPDGDYWFTQLLTLQYDERAFLRAANTWDQLAGGQFVGQGVDADVLVAAAA